MLYDYYASNNANKVLAKKFWETDDDELKKSKEYKLILESIDELESLGVLERTTGYCIATTDIVSKLLRSKGIECSIVECSLMVINKKNNRFNFVGYDDANKDESANKICSHMICITKTEIPVLIDLSVPYMVPEKPYIIERVNKDKNLDHSSIVSEYEFEHSTWSYSEKLNSQYPLLHQQNIVDRIETDIKIEKRIRSNENQIKIIQNIVFAILCVSSINMIRGFYDHYQKYVIKDNGFGPNKIHLDNYHLEKNQ